MILISHRGNINGRIPERENHPDYIQEALDLGYDVEIDVWCIEDKLYLGHDEPQYNINKSFLRNDRLWVHCKNPEALNKLKLEKINIFYHETDTVALTSFGYIWAYPGKQPIKNSIAVMPELYLDNISQCIGICSDNIQNYK